jgi:hypothetical protein
MVNTPLKAPRVSCPQYLITGDPTKCWGIVYVKSARDFHKVSKIVAQLIAIAPFHRAELRE